MSSNGDIYSHIIDEITIFKPEIIYLAVGFLATCEVFIFMIYHYILSRYYD